MLFNFLLKKEFGPRLKLNIRRILTNKVLLKTMQIDEIRNLMRGHVQVIRVCLIIGNVFFAVYFSFECVPTDLACSKLG